MAGYADNSVGEQRNSRRSKRRKQRNIWFSFSPKIQISFTQNIKNTFFYTNSLFFSSLGFILYFYVLILMANKIYITLLFSNHFHHRNKQCFTFFYESIDK